MKRDTVAITGVRAAGCHGVLDFEKINPQPFEVDIEMTIDTSLAAATDDLAASISYAEAAAAAVSVIQGETVDLIETLASRIAESILARGVLAVDITVHKPQAPVGIPFSDVHVKIHRDGPLLASGTIRRVVVGLGSNLGDSQARIAWAVEEISALDVAVDCVSTTITSPAQLAPGQDPQPDYSNAVVVLTTAMAPADLLETLQRIEVRGGRVRHERWGARTLDIDIIDVEGVESSLPALELPHPRAAERLFVLEPWLEIEPEARLAGVSVRHIVAELRSR